MRRFLVEEFEPAYLRLFREGMLPARVEAGLRELADCHACPRNCACNRLQNETRACHTGRFAIVSSAFPHFGEEDCLRGWRGSGTIFFGLCNLRCAFCQNWDISQKLEGKECGPREIAALMINLQEHGCHNINRPEYQVGQIAANGAVKHPDINRRPTPEEMQAAYTAARRAGLWRFDVRASVVRES